MANPYATATAATSPREEQAIAFRLVNRKLTQADTPPTRNAALGLNHELWSILFRDLGSSENRLPPVLRQDCIRLARWSMAYSTQAVLQDLPLAPLVAINEDMVEGLS
ncbi:flagellar biosynthesis regulator FlaF [Lichenicoccus roseus]|uniref:Flagellin assembly protein n=1 Tax=Lichenicoccus roseus TaxID=2683649 RepID=A0A5R9JBC8_9PROT|nr:flagellar biosynthesis regulator FlaF [Lichenicoccus roseus]TLU72696.1 flagellin assembly protein [Lichenicoccus roseus]